MKSSEGTFIYYEGTEGTFITLSILQKLPHILEGNFVAIEMPLGIS